MNTAPASTSTETALVQTGLGLSSAASFDHIQRVAKLFSESQLVPSTFQKNLPNCVIAIEMAHRMGASPLAVMQNLNVIHGRPSFSAQFNIASINSCGRFTALRFDIKQLGKKTVKYSYWTGSKFDGNRKKVDAEEVIDDVECIAWAYEVSRGEKGTERLESAPVSIEMAVKEGWYSKQDSKWQTMAPLMLRYRASTFFCRMYAPELLMGLQTAEEVVDIEEVERVATPVTTITETASQSAGATGSELTGKRGRGGVNAAKKAANEIVVPAETKTDTTKPAETTEPKTETPPVTEPATTEPAAPKAEEAFTLTDETQTPPAAPAEPVAPPPPAGKICRCEVVSIAPRRTTTGPVLEVTLKGEFDGKAYFVGTAEKFPAGVNSVGDFTVETKDAGGKSVSFINSVNVLA